MIDEDEVGLKEKPEDYIHQKDYIKIRPAALGVRAKDLIINFAIIENCRLGNGQGCHSDDQGCFLRTVYHLHNVIKEAAMKEDFPSDIEMSREDRFHCTRIGISKCNLLSLCIGIEFMLKTNVTSSS